MVDREDASPPAPARWREALLKFLVIGASAFGSARQAYLYEAFVRTGWIPRELFLRDFAMTQVLPGATFVNHTLLCGLRLGGLPMGIAGVALVFLPGTVAMVAAMVLLPPTDPHVMAAFHGILVGAAAVLLALCVKTARTLTSRLDVALTITALGLMLAGLPLVLTLATVGGVGVWLVRPRRAAAG